MAPRGNSSALKHGLYSKRATSAHRRRSIPAAQQITAQLNTLARVIDRAAALAMKAKGKDLAQLTNSLSSACTASFSGHRTLLLLTGRTTPIDDALRELARLPLHVD